MSSDSELLFDRVIALFLEAGFRIESEERSRGSWFSQSLVAREAIQAQVTLERCCVTVEVRNGKQRWSEVHLTLEVLGIIEGDEQLSASEATDCFLRNFSSFRERSSNVESFQAAIQHRRDAMVERLMNRCWPRNDEYESGA